MGESLSSNSEVIRVDEQLELRQLQPEDATALFEVIASNRGHLGQWLSWAITTRTVEDSRKFILETQLSRKIGAAAEYGMIFNGDLVGHVSLMHLNDGQTPEIGYWIKKDMTGKGITTKAAKALSDYGFDALALSRIVIRAEPDNIASNKVAERLGYIQRKPQFDQRIQRIVNVWAMDRHLR